MRIEYIFIRFLQFMSYRNFEQKTIFWFSKEEVSLKVKKKSFGRIFFYASVNFHAIWRKQQPKFT
jgi:desulfoferrodoxin (superoxide reductase-like protein)